MLADPFIKLSEKNIFIKIIYFFYCR